MQLIGEIHRNGELTKFNPIFQRRKIYDQYEKDYI